MNTEKLSLVQKCAHLEKQLEDANSCIHEKDELLERNSAVSFRYQIKYFKYSFCDMIGDYLPKSRIQ